VPDTIAERLQQVRQRLHDAEAAAGRAPGSVQLLAVSKTQPSASIRAAWLAGQRRFGENYLQEAEQKARELADLAIDWHFIGRIQSNKTRLIAHLFSWVHSLDDLHHAQRLSAQRPADWPPLNVCIQVNVSTEASKGGVAPEQLEALLEQCASLPRLRLRGLMAIPAPAATPAAQRQPLHRLRELRDRLASAQIPLETLSMGMSADLEAAVAEGASVVRIGTAIFGPRHYPERKP
jgi:pyridoxal phosphate enzyme (YggS family)